MAKWQARRVPPSLVLQRYLDPIKVYKIYIKTYTYNVKFEIRISKLETNSKYELPKSQTAHWLLGDFCFENSYF